MSRRSFSAASSSDSSGSAFFLSLLSCLGSLGVGWAVVLSEDFGAILLYFVSGYYDENDE